MEQYVLSFDYGTQSIRGAVYDPQGELLWKKKYTMPSYLSLKPGWAEIDPIVYRTYTVNLIHDLKREAPELHAKVRALVLSSMRDCVTLVDENGSDLRPMILWFDQRKNEKVYPSNPLILKAASLIGAEQLIRDNAQASHINWMRDHEPELWAKAHKVVFLSAYLHRWLLGRFVDSTSNQSGHISFDSKRLKWSGLSDIKKMVFPIEPEKLVDLVAPGTVMGPICEKAAAEIGFDHEVLVIASASDKACETLGSGCADNRHAVLSFGSQATIETVSPRYYELETFVPAFPAALPNSWNPEMQVFRGYWMVSRFLEVLESNNAGTHENIHDLLEEYLSTTPAGNEGLVLYPYMGASPQYPNSSGTIMGLRDFHEKKHLYRAIVEGINYNLRQAIEIMEQKQKQSIDYLIITGGGANSDRIAQITADMFHRPVSRIECWDSTILGAAILGYCGLGTFRTYDQAIAAMVRPRDTFLPDPDNAALYNRCFSEYKKNLKTKIHYNPAL